MTSATTILAQAAVDTAVLSSWLKPLLTLGVAAGWGWAFTRIDKDADFFYLRRRLFNALLLLAGVVAFGAMLLIPIFLIGLPVGVLILAGSLFGYAVYRNQNVPAHQRWSLSLDSFRQRLGDYQQAAATRSAAIKFKTPKGRQLDVPLANDPDNEAHRALAEALDFAFPRGADTLELSVDTHAANFQVKVDGVRYPQPAPEPKLAVAVIDYVKKIGELDLADRRRKQNASILATSEEHGDHTLQLTTAGSTQSLSLAVDIDPQTRGNIPLDLLGLLPKQLAYLKQQLGQTTGVVLIAGEKHQGVPTTRYSLLHDIDPYTNSVVTFEEQVEHELEGVENHLIDRGAPASEFNQKLGVLIRADPSVLMLGKVADAETCKLMARAAAEMRLIAPVPQKDTTTALKAWVKAVGEPKLAAEALSFIMAQRLVRRLCTTCRIPYTPDPSAVKKLNLPPDKVGTLYRSSGKVLVKDREQPCPNCHGLGYRARVGVFEVMPLDDTARGYIAKQQWDPLTSHLRKAGMVYLQEAALAKVVEGVTDIKEVQRALKS